MKEAAAAAQNKEKSFNRPGLSLSKTSCLITVITLISGN